VGALSADSNGQEWGDCRRQNTVSEAAACSPAPATPPRRAIVAGSRAALQHMATTPRWHQWQRLDWP
jgi:hypothetical protein